MHIVHSSGSLPETDQVTLPIEVPSNDITYSWYNVNVFTRSSKAKAFKKNKGGLDEKHILKDVTGICRPGELLAIMGASGAGKTTLLNVLTARSSRKLRIEGELYVNGEPVNQNKLTSQSAYVQQEDLFVGTCTVKEQLIFQAILRMDKHISLERRMERVEEVITEMGLGKCKDTVIGIAGRLKGISGGEMKRLAFACEVLTNPPLMFCDEPTTGLDSFMAQTIISAMKTVVQNGKCIISTIHQPSSEVFLLFDRVLLMAEGRVAYLGLVSGAQEFFSKLDRRIPLKFNPADFFISTLAIKPDHEWECERFVNETCEYFITSEEGKDLMSAINENMTVNNSKQNIGIMSRLTGKQRMESPYKSSWATQFVVLVKRNWTQVFREPYLWKMKFIQTIAVAVLMGLVYLDTDDYYDQNKVRDINGVLFILISQTSFQFSMGVINVFCAQLPIFLREHFSGMYRTSIFYFTRGLAEIPETIVLPVGFLLILYFMININESASSFFTMALTMILVANCALSFGYMLSCAVNNVYTGLAILAPTLIPLMLFGGLFLNSETVPIYFIWVKYISWFNYGYEILMITQWKDVEKILSNNSTIDCGTGPEVIEALGYDVDNVTFNMLMMLALIVGYRTLAYLFLLRKTYQRQ